MKSITFKHPYPKMCGQTSGRLVAVLPIMIDRGSPDELMKYETTYSEDGRYFYDRLENGKYIQLVFVGNLGIPFSDIREAWPENRVRFFYESVNEEFSFNFTKGGSTWNKNTRNSSQNTSSNSSETSTGKASRHPWRNFSRRR
jgi:hypothetical protein